ncbi:hypothetical protein BS78_08G096700 [Paspalum vaginatum]|nr:hypothetical protein BS78_08G096700 [Paspalum vaginatum]
MPKQSNSNAERGRGTGRPRQINLDPGRGLRRRLRVYRPHVPGLRHEPVWHLQAVRQARFLPPQRIQRVLCHRPRRHLLRLGFGGRVAELKSFRRRCLRCLLPKRGPRSRRRLLRHQLPLFPTSEQLLHSIVGDLFVFSHVRLWLILLSSRMVSAVYLRLPRSMFVSESATLQTKPSYYILTVQPCYL